MTLPCHFLLLLLSVSVTICSRTLVSSFSSVLLSPSPLSLSPPLSVCMYVCMLSVCLSVSVSLSLCRSKVDLCLCLSVSFLCLCLSPSLCLCLCLYSVDHSILLRKLSLYGICDNAIGILKSYLQNRTQCCVVNNTISESKMINSGVPQGSILGPLLFLLYINDLPNCLEFSTPGMFADDTQLSVAATNLGELEQLLNRDITNLDIWLRANRLAANATKTLFMVIASNYKLNQLAFNPNIKLNQKTIRQVTKAKLLGVSIDAELSWASHINDIIIPKVLRGLRILRTFRGTLPTEQLVSLYNALILPHFDYCSIIWGNCGLVLKNKLQVLQNRAARIITNSPYEVRSYKILNKLGWDNLEMRRNKQKSTLMYNIVKSNAPISLKDLFVRSKELHEYDLRSSAVDLKLPLPHTEFLKRSLSFGGAKLWNSLPSVIKNVDSFKLFKSSIAKFDF